ncbi:uncharacterized protein GGS25DRAFT_469596 [Hypoxylon fragiforme]|uniref:uncharacterized protein n=1 Tax=Hypoxylon fragiforme TaxID=63214 RepID=UPI0020C60618|nr:uncharacterized protein GGS25DRAFT_469596 [Hypoxylon fragiforme]KAI2613917.1 hypothetical protein GGS25DRAFT_469596 [Hypoxylon fragiforme]
MAWQGRCFRAGMMLALTRHGRAGANSTYELVLFQPKIPQYVNAAEPKSRRSEQETWIGELLEKLDDQFRVTRGWVGGKALAHVEKRSSRRVSPDSVEVSCEIIEELMIDVGTLPTNKTEFLDRGFQEMDRYSSS